MDNKTFNILAAVLIIGTAILTSFKPSVETITHEGDTTVINTTEIGKGIKGYNGATPVKIYIVKNKVVKIKPLRNQETPKYFAKAKGLLSKWEGKTVSKAQKENVDAVSGATFSSKALIQNVEKGLEFYKKRK